MADKRPPRVAVIVKGYPRLSETFIAQEIHGLEARGLHLAIWSLRHPTETLLHPIHARIAARVSYLPEYLHRGPLRVLRGLLAALRRPAFGRLMGVFWADLRRDPTANRLRRLGQAFVLAREIEPGITHLHVHYLHTPASVVRYAAILTGLRWSFSAHAKDIWTTPDWEKREKLAEAEWGVTCTALAAGHLSALAPPSRPVALVYHGLDLSRLPAPPVSRTARDGSDPDDPVRIVSIGRAVAKKGYDDGVRALASLPDDLHWRFAHVGGGALLPALKDQADAAGLKTRCHFGGARTQPEIMALLREADLFVLPSKAAADGDRDGLPNVLMEAASQKLAIVSTDFAGIPEFIRDGRDGVLAPPGDWEGLANALNLLIRDPARRQALGESAFQRLTEAFSAGSGLDRIAAKLAGEASPDGQARDDATAPAEAEA